MWLHVADIWAKKTPEKSGQFLYEQTGSKERANAWPNWRSWWVAAVIEFAGTERDVHKHPECMFGRGCVLVVDGGKQACNITYHPFNTFSTCLTVWLSTAFCNALLSQPCKQLLCSSLGWKLLNTHQCWRICLGKRLLSMLCPLFLFRETCLWIYEDPKSIIHRPGKTGTDYLLLVWDLMPN